MDKMKAQQPSVTVRPLSPNWERDFLEEIKPLQDGMAYIIARTPVSYYATDGKLSVAIYPVEVQAQLDTLQGFIDAIAEKYKHLAESAGNSVDIIREVLTHSGRELDEDALKAARKFADGPADISTQTARLHGRKKIQ
jgi:hypothetical protein